MAGVSIGNLPTIGELAGILIGEALADVADVENAGTVFRTGGREVNRSNPRLDLKKIANGVSPIIRELL